MEHDGELKIPCSHWSACGVTGGGCCSIGEHERPGFGVCLNICTAYDGPNRTKEMIREILGSVSSNVRRAGCCGDDVKRIWWPIIVWAGTWWPGIEWVGVPKPVRWWRWAFTHGHPHPGTDIMWPGCGCIGYLYDLCRYWQAWQKHRYWKRRRFNRKIEN